MVHALGGLDMGMTKEEFMKRYKADIEKKAKKKRDNDYECIDYIIKRCVKQRRGRR